MDAKKLAVFSVKKHAPNCGQKTYFPCIKKNLEGIRPMSIDHVHVLFSKALYNRKLYIYIYI